MGFGSIENSFGPPVDSVLPPEKSRGGKGPKSPEAPALSPESPVVVELCQLLGPLVGELLRGPGGELDLSKIRAKGFGEFREFLETQVSVDHQSLNQNDLKVGDWRIGLSAYHKVLGREKYQPLLRLLHRAGEGLDSKGSGYEDLLKEFTAELIAVSADSFVGQSWQTKEGRGRLRRILGEEGYFSKALRADLLKSIAAVGDAQNVAGVNYEGITEQVSTWNYFNISVTEAEVERATVHALKILEEAGEREAEVLDFEKRYLEAPGAVVVLGAKVGGYTIGAEDLRNKVRVYQENQGRADVLSQLKAKLARVWLMAVDDAHWVQPNPLATAGHRAYVAHEVESLLAETEYVTGEKGLRRLHEKVQDFLQSPLPEAGESEAWTWLRHKTLGHGLSELCSPMSSSYQAPYQALRQFSDEIAHTIEMGEKVHFEIADIPAKDPKVQAAALQFIHALNQVKRSLWYGYKQHKAISRLGSRVAERWDGGDIVDIRKANGKIDSMIGQLKSASGKEGIEKVVTELYMILKKEGILQKAMVAAEMDGTEQVLGLGQTVLIILGTTAVTGGLGAVAALGNGGRSLAALATAARTASLAERAVYGMKMGSWISLAENGMALATGEVRSTPDTLFGWTKDSLATGLAMGMFTPLAAQTGYALERNVLRNLLRRYFTGGVKGVAHFSGDTALEGMEEIFDATLRHKLDLKKGGIGWDQLREITTISAAGGGAKVGAVVQGFRAQRQKFSSPLRGESLPLPGWTTALAGAATGILTLVGPDQSHAAHQAMLSVSTSGNPSLLGWGLGLSVLGMAVTLGKKHIEAEHLLKSPDSAVQISGLEALGRILTEGTSGERLAAARTLRNYSTHENKQIRNFARDTWMEGMEGLEPAHLEEFLRDSETWWDQVGLETVSGLIEDMVKRLPEDRRLAPTLKLVDLSGKRRGKEQKNILAAIKGIIPFLRIRDRDRVIGALERLKKSEALSESQKSHLAKLLNFSQTVSKLRKFFGIPWVPLRSATDVLEGLSSPRAESREEALRLLKTLYRRLPSPGLRLKYLINAGVRGQSPELSQWTELQEVLQEVRDAMDPMDVDLADLGIAAQIQGDQAIRDYVGALKPGEVKSLRLHLWETYLKGIPPEDISTALFPEVIFKLISLLKQRKEVPEPEILTGIPSYRDTDYASETEKSLAEIGSSDPQIREQARSSILRVYGSLQTPSERLAFVIELGKKSHQPNLEQWEELHETLHLVREGMDLREVELADMGILLGLEGKDVLTEFLSEMEQGEIQDLRRYILHNYLADDATPEALAKAPEIIGRLWPELNKPNGFGGLGTSGDLFSLGLGLATSLSALGDSSHQEWTQAAVSFSSGDHVGLLTSLGLGLGALAMAAMRGSSKSKKRANLKIRMKGLRRAGMAQFDSGAMVLGYFRSLQDVAAQIKREKWTEADILKDLQGLWDRFFGRILPQVNEDMVAEIFDMVPEGGDPLAVGHLLGLIYQLHPQTQVREKSLKITSLNPYYLRFAALKFLAQHRFDSPRNKLDFMKRLFSFLGEVGEGKESQWEDYPNFVQALEDLWEFSNGRLIPQISESDLKSLQEGIAVTPKDEMELRLVLHLILSKHPDPQVRDTARQMDEAIERGDLKSLSRRIKEWPLISQTYQRLLDQEGKGYFLKLIDAAISKNREHEVLELVHFLTYSKSWQENPVLRHDIRFHSHPEVRKAYYLLALGLVTQKEPHRLVEVFENYWPEEFPLLTANLSDPDPRVREQAQLLWTFLQSVMEGEFSPPELDIPNGQKKKTFPGGSGPLGSLNAVGFGLATALSGSVDKAMPLADGAMPQVVQAGNDLGLLLLTGAVASAGFLFFQFLQILRISSFCKEAENDPQALHWLVDQARPNTLSILNAIAMAAETNPQAVNALRDLHLRFGFDARTKRLLQDLKVDTLTEKAKSSPEALFALLVLTRFGNKQAHQALETLDLQGFQKNRVGTDPNLIYLIFQVIQTSGNKTASDLLRQADKAVLKDHKAAGWRSLSVLHHLALFGDKDLKAHLQKLDLSPVISQVDLSQASPFLIQGVLPIALMGNESASSILQAGNPYALFHNRAVDSENLRTLGIMSEWGNRAALQMLAELADSHPEAVFWLMRLAYEGNPYAGNYLRTLSPQIHAEFAPESRHGRMALIELANFGNRAAHQALEDLVRIYPELRQMIDIQGTEGWGHRSVGGIFAEVESILFKNFPGYEVLPQKTKAEFLQHLMRTWRGLSHSQKETFFQKDQKAGVVANIPNSFVTEQGTSFGLHEAGRESSQIRKMRR